MEPNENPLRTDPSPVLVHNMQQALARNMLFGDQENLLLYIRGCHVFSTEQAVLKMQATVYTLVCQQWH